MLMPVEAPGKVRRSLRLLCRTAAAIAKTQYTQQPIINKSAKITPNPLWGAQK
jgi:hypothetical protein